MSEATKENEAKRWARYRWATVFVAALMIGFVAVWADPGKARASPVERIFLWTFLIFSVGLAELFLLFVGLTILGRIDLTKAFEDKDRDATEGALPARSEARLGAVVSLSRLQAFLWTLIVMCVFFHAAVKAGGAIPTIPPELLLVMGISGAVYLAGKEVNVRGSDSGQARPPPPAPEKP
jgi:hypothetical protein